jgi:hypothetical protein
MVQPSAKPGVGRSFSTGSPGADSAMSGRSRKKRIRQTNTDGNRRFVFIAYEHCMG